MPETSSQPPSPGSDSNWRGSSVHLMSSTISKCGEDELVAEFKDRVPGNGGPGTVIEAADVPTAVREWIELVETVGPASKLANERTTVRAESIRLESHRRTQISSEVLHTRRISSRQRSRCTCRADTAPSDEPAGITLDMAADALRVTDAFKKGTRRSARE